MNRLLPYAKRTTRGIAYTLAVVSLITMSTLQALGPNVSSAAEDDILGNRNLAAGPDLLCGPSDPFSPELVDEETLWLARCIYSETKLEHEQELVAWVVRNRVDSQYRGRTTYKEAVLDPYQFSAFNLNAPRPDYYKNVPADYQIPSWKTALRIAYRVMRADSSERPFSVDTRHFYSEISRLDGSPPDWAESQTPTIIEDRDVEPRRFRFFGGVM